MIIETCNRSRGINDAWAQASREFVIHRRIENPLRVIRSSLTGGVNRTAVVVLRSYVTLCTEYDWNDTVSRENGHDSETSFIDRDVGTLQERNICPSFVPPPSVRPSFLHEFQLASPEGASGGRWSVAWCWKRVRKRQTFHRRLIRD